MGVIFKEGYFSLLCYFLLNETFLGLSSPPPSYTTGRQEKKGRRQKIQWGGEREREKEKKKLSPVSLSLSLPNQRKGNIRQVFCVASPVKVERERKEIKKKKIPKK